MNENEVNATALYAFVSSISEFVERMCKNDALNNTETSEEYVLYCKALRDFQYHLDECVFFEVKRNSSDDIYTFKDEIYK